MNKKSIYFMLALWALALYPTQAMAYIDPGSGSAMMSVIIGLVVAVGLTLKTFWYKITSIFKRTPSSKTSDSTEDKE